MSDEVIITVPEKKRALITAIVCANIVTMLNAGSVNIATPVFMDIFSANLNHVQWVMLIYILALASVMPMVSALCERFTYRRVFLFSLAGIGLSSLLCAMAQNLMVLIGFRLLSGFFAGVIVSTSMALIYRFMPVSERAGYYGTMLVLQSVSFAIGPSFAGLVMAFISWRGIFIIPSAVVLLAFFQASKALPEENADKSIQLHILGVSMVSVATGIFLFAFTFLERWGIDDVRFWGMIALASLMVAAFILHNRNNPHPALDFKLFRVKSFALTILLSLLLSTAMGITASILAVYVQSIRGYLAFFSGAVQFMPALMMAGANYVTKKIYNKQNTGIITFVGFAIAAVGNLIFLWVGMDTPLWLVSMLLCIRYIGIGCIRMPVSDFGMKDMRADRVSHASALINWVNQLAQAVSTNILTVVFTWHTNNVWQANGYTGEALVGKPGFNVAALSGVHLVFLVFTVLMALGALCALAMKPRFLPRRHRFHPNKAS